MAEFVRQSEDESTSECFDELLDGVADCMIDTLRELNQEYDSLVKNAEEVMQLNRFPYEVKTCQNDKGQYFIHDVIKQGISGLDDMKRRWEEQELFSKLEEIQNMLKVIQEERESCIEKKNIMERRLKIEKMKIESLNKQIEVSLMIAEEVKTTEGQLETVIDDLRKLSVTKDIFPTAILEAYSAYNRLQKRIEEMEQELLKYTDLPSDYVKAKEKLTEKMLYERELENRIRNAVK